MHFHHDKEQDLKCENSCHRRQCELYYLLGPRPPRLTSSSISWALDSTPRSSPDEVLASGGHGIAQNFCINLGHLSFWWLIIIGAGDAPAHPCVCGEIFKGDFRCAHHSPPTHTSSFLQLFPIFLEKGMKLAILPVIAFAACAAAARNFTVRLDDSHSRGH